MPVLTACANVYSQCGGQNWPGPFCCEASECVFVNQYYSQCLPNSSSTTSNPSSSTSTPSSSTSNPSPSGTPGPVNGISPGSVTKNYLPPFPITVDGEQKSTLLTIDANWRWVHTKEGYQNCFSEKGWDPKSCPDPKTCAANCVIEGVSQEQWKNTYGVNVNGNSVTLNLVTGSNIGSRLYVLDSEKAYYGFNLLNRQFSFDVDVSKLNCGLNGALYLVSMDLENPDPSVAGPAYGTGYADAQCPADIKYVRGLPNVEAIPKQVCAAELDIWEANKFSQAFTPHPCKNPGVTVCSDGADCGNQKNRYKGQCDKDGADYNPYRLNITDFYGPGLKVDTTKPFTVATQFITSDNSDKGDLVMIKRIFKQNGVEIDGGSTTDQTTLSQKKLFGEYNHNAELGGYKAMGKSLASKMVLVLSVWGDTAVNMEWLDANYPLGSQIPGSKRGPCPHGTYQETIASNQNAAVTFGNIKIESIKA